MKKTVLLLLALALLTGCVQGMSEETDWFTENELDVEGYILDGDTLYFPEGIETIG